MKNTGQDFSLDETRARVREHDLLASIVERAIFDIKSPDIELSRHAHNWIFSNSVHPWSCRWVLEQLELGNGWPILKDKITALELEIVCKRADAYEAHGMKRMISKFNQRFLCK